MDDDAAVGVLREAADALAQAAATGLQHVVPIYPSWSVADLIVHTGRIHRWVAHIIESRATRRPPQPDVSERPDDLIGWFRAGAAGVANQLAASSPTLAVWTFAGEPTASFWRRRMALETTIHRWDVQTAVGDPTSIAEDVAAAGVTEALEIYLVPRSRGTAVGGDGEVAVLRATDGGHAWAVRLHSDAIEVISAHHHGDVRITAPASQLWLFLMGRVRGDTLDPRGASDIVGSLERVVAALPTPSR